MDPSLFKPYHGCQSSIIPFSSGHYFYLASWDQIPTKHAHFSYVWLVTPEDKRILFSDPSETSAIVCIYHEFHEIHAASIELKWISETRLNVHCKSQDDGYEMDVTFHLHEPLSSRLLVSLDSGPPTRFKLSRSMVVLSILLVNLLIAKGGSTLVGKTETGQPFYHGETE